MPGLGLAGERVRREGEHGNASALGGVEDARVVEAPGQIEEEETGPVDARLDLVDGAGDDQGHAGQASGLTDTGDEEEVLDDGEDLGRTALHALIALLTDAEPVPLPLGNVGESGQVTHAIDVHVPVEMVGLVLGDARSEEHTSELQSPYDLVCRLLLEKKKKKKREVDVLGTTHS